MRALLLVGIGILLLVAATPADASGSDVYACTAIDDYGGCGTGDGTLCYVYVRASPYATACLLEHN